MTIPAGTLVPRDARAFGSYELIAKIATGGMAEIYLARPVGGNAAPGDDADRVVVKRILPHLAEDEHFVTMFRDEADLARRLVHPNVCRVYNLGHHDATWFIAMEYLHGVPLSRMLSKLAKRRGMIDYRVVAAMICQACDGLHHAHEVRDERGTLLGVVHRDVSPPNIMLVAEGTVKLLDFGIAKARGANSRTRTGTVKGKNAYMSPEQILGKPLDRRSDVFALGAVMYELLAVRRLFHRDSDFLTFKAITEDPVPEIRERRPDIPPGMRDALIKALARDPSGRFATARAFGEAVRQSVASIGGPATVAELAAYVAAEFGDELTARDELLEAAKAPAPLTGPALDPHRAPTVPAGDVLELEAVGGELEATKVDARALDDGPRDAVPSMIVFTGTGSIPALRPPVATPPPMPAPLGRASTPLAVPIVAPGLHAAPTAPIAVSLPTIDPSFIALPEGPTTDILRAYRRKNLRNTLAILAAVGGAIVLIALLAQGDDAPPKPATSAAVAVESVDARPPDAAPAPDADRRAAIIAASKFGRLTLHASEPTEVFINGTRYGMTPLVDVQLPPGKHKVRAKGPAGKLKNFDITIIAAKDLEAPVITW